MPSNSLKNIRKLYITTKQLQISSERRRGKKG